MKVGLIGFGSIGKRHYQNLTKHTTDVVVLSKRKDISVSCHAQSWQAFAAHGPYDAIFIANETFKHIPTLKKSLALKPRAIFMEKPLSHNLAGLTQMAREIKRSRVSLWVGYNFHFFKPFIKIKHIVESNKLGKIYYLRASIGQDLRTWRKRDYRQNYSSKRRQGGGVALDLVHDINYPAWLLNDRLVPEVAVVKKLSRLETDTEDSVETILHSERKRILVTVHQDCLRVPRKQSVEIGGDKATLEWDSISNAISIQTPTKIFRQTVLSERNEMFVNELKFFMSQVKKKKFFSNIDEAIHDIKIISFVKKYGKK